MCGRFALTATTKDVEKLKPTFKMSEDFVPRYNISPTQTIVASLNIEPFTISKVKWGLIPSWSKDDSFSAKMINARSETLFEKPSFKNLINKKRCLVFASGYYEWQKSSEGKSKQPYYIYIENEPVFTFAGLWDSWLNKETGELINSATIITTDSTGILSQVHERMPLFINENDREKWLDTNLDTKYISNLLQNSINNFKFHPISNEVNSAKNDYPEIIKSIETL